MTSAEKWIQLIWPRSRRVEVVKFWMHMEGWWELSCAVQEVSWCPHFYTVWGSLSSFSLGRKWFFLPKEFKNPSLSPQPAEDWWSYRENTAAREGECTGSHKETEWSCWQTQKPEIREKCSEETPPELESCIGFWMKAKPSTESIGKTSAPLMDFEHRDI